MKRAAIYVRVSTEAQADRVSPQEQENDCRQLCASKGYEVVKVYRDTEKYKSRGRIVEPSGTRADRPGFKAMLADARQDAFDMIIAWREDRLYRGSKPMSDVKDVLAETDIDIELVKETFDRKMMWIKAGFAEMELEAIKERTAMGMGARLREGKFYWSVPIFGYDYDRENGVTINEEEARWVRLIWQWFGEGIGAVEIRRRLIEGGAKQKQTGAGDKKRKRQWALHIIRNILHREEYYTGVWKKKWGKIEGTKYPKVYEFSIPTIIDVRLYESVKERSKQWQLHPAGNWHSNTLIAGLIYCATCGCKMSAIKKTIAHGKYTYYYYKCNSDKRREATPGCARLIKQEDADWNVWGSLWSILTEPGRFEFAIQERMKQLQAEEADATTDMAALERQLDDILMERQRVIGLARKGIITEDDLVIQLAPLTMQEKAIKREIQDRRLLTGNQAAQLMGLIDIFRQQVQDDLKALHPDAIPVDEEQAREQFKVKRRFVKALVKQVLIMPDKSYRIEMEAGLSPLPEFRDDSLLVHLVEPVYD